MSSAATAGSYSNRSGLSKSWKTVKTHAGVYTGGKVEIFHHNGASLIACMLHDDVAILDAKTGELKRTLQQDVEDVSEMLHLCCAVEEAKESFVVFAVRPGHNQLVTAGRNLLLRLWDLDTFTCLRTIKAHDTPVLAMDFDPTGTLLATGGSDRAVKVFDIEKGYCTHNFRRHSGIVTLVQFHPDAKRLQLVSCSDDSTVRIWDLYSQKEFACIQDHMSPATCVAFSMDGYTMLTAGRDRVVNFWDLRNNALRQTVVIHEAIEGIEVLPSTFKCVSSKQHDDSAIYFVTAGERGLLQLWCATGSSCNTVFTQKPESDSLKYTGLLLNASRKELMAISADQNFLVFNEHLARTTQIIGFNDDILNLKYISNADGTPSKQIAVATNSDQIRLINRETLSCELLSGHTDIVMALAVSPDGKWLVSASKDRTARLWDVKQRKLLATCTGHTEALGAIAISQKLPHFNMGTAFFVTGSSDKTLKMWSLKPLAGAYNDRKSVEVTTLTTLGAVKAHEKDVNAIAVSPNDRFIASASQDKLIKVWHAQSGNGASVLTLAGTCRGHKRGVWAVEFSPVDQCLASAGGDKTIKVWSAKDFTCLKTFEGHTASVLNVQFVCAGMQLMSAGADGLVKLWTIKSNECEATLDNHMDKIWALAVAKDSSEMISGGADSTINLWRDFTEEEELNLQMEKEGKLLKEQELFNCLRQDKLLDAVQIAFELGHPNRLLQILCDLLEGPRHKDEPVLPGGAPIDPDVFVPEEIFAQVITSLDDTQLKTLLDWVRDWNTNAKHSAICQVLISSMLRELPPAKLKTLDSVGKTLEALIAYSERHFQRIDRMLQKSYLVDFSIVSMKNLFPVEELSAAAALTADASTTSDESEQEDVEIEVAEQPVEEEVTTKSKRRKSAAPAAGTTKNHASKKKPRV
ncbi:U3 small nucleolar rna-associated protein, partial [Globisporangium splendens]